MHSHTTIIALFALLFLSLSLTSVSAKLQLDCDTVGGSNGSTTWQMSNSYFPPTDQNTGGWTALPEGSNQVCGADLVRINVGSKGATLPLYVSNDTEDDEVVRVVVIMPPVGRAIWDYFTQVRNARQRAEAEFGGIDATKIAIIGVGFFTVKDQNAGASLQNDYIWGGNSWMHGGHAAAPASASPHHTSAFEATDDVIAWIRQRYPKNERIVVSGHSAGAQQVNRYATMSKLDLGSDVHFWIANPSSYVWMESNRPVAPNNCPQYDDYKYGLSGNMSSYVGGQMTSNGKSGLLNRLAGRYIHILVGDKDDGPGDTACQAETQGSNHYERSMNYVSSIKGLNVNNGNLPDNWTFDQVPDCSHDSNCMFQSYIGQQHLFSEGYPGATKPWDRKKGGAKSASSSKASTSSATKSSVSSSSTSMRSSSSSTKSKSTSKPTSTSASSKKATKTSSSNARNTARAIYAREARA